MSNLPSIRKAAILVASLDVDSADLLLAQMSDGQADDVRRAILELGEPDPAEQRAVLDEFFRIGPMAPAARSPDADLEDHLQAGLRSDIDEFIPPTSERETVQTNTSSPAKFSDTKTSTGIEPKVDIYRRPDWNRLLPDALRHSVSSSQPATNILEEAEPEALVAFLEHEHPQAIALVIAHLSPARAGHILARLPAALQTDVVQRLVDLEETDPNVLREIELAIEGWFRNRHPARRRMVGVAAVSAILSASEGSARRQIMNNLSIHQRGLAQKLAPPPKPPRKFSFSEICRWPIENLADLVIASDRRTAALALAGASAELVADLLQCLETDEADSLSRRLTNLGPMRLVDIDRAQEALAEFASRLYGEGKIANGKQPHLTAIA